MKVCDDPGHDDYGRLCCPECGEPSVESVLAENAALKARLEDIALAVDLQLFHLNGGRVDARSALAVISAVVKDNATAKP